MDVMVDELPGVFGDVLDHAPGCELDDALDDAASWWVDSVPDAVPESGPEDADDLLDRLVALERRRSQLAAMEADLLVRLAGQDVQHRQVSVLDPVSDAERLLDIADEVREEIAAVLRRAPGAVHDQLVAARLLVGPMRRTLDALAAGLITEANAKVLAEGADVLHRSLGADADAFERSCATLQDRLLARAESCTRSQLRRAVRAAVAAIDAAGERERRRQARAQVDVCVYPDDDGLSVLMARMTTVDATRVLAAVNAVAASGTLITDCDATLGERRAAALLALATGTPDEVGPQAQARAQVRAEVQVTVALADLLDGADGSGPIGALLEDPTVPIMLRRLVTDPLTGRALDLGRRRYEVSEALRRWIVARDRTCRFPGCSRRAAACQVDHVTAWSDEGATDAANLHALCTRHHQLKTHAGWEVRRDDGTGLTVWSSPAGRTYWVDPDPPPEIVAA